MCPVQYGRIMNVPPEPVEPEPVEVDEDVEEVEVPSASAPRPELEQFAVDYAGMTPEEAADYPNKGELHAAILEALD